MRNWWKWRMLLEIAGVHPAEWHWRHSTWLDTVGTMNHASSDRSLLLVVDALFHRLGSLGHVLEVQVATKGVCMGLCLHHFQRMLVLITFPMDWARPNHHLLGSVRLHHLVIEHALLLGKQVFIAVFLISRSKSVLVVAGKCISPVLGLDLKVFLFTYVHSLGRVWCLSEQTAWLPVPMLDICCKRINSMLLIFIVRVRVFLCCRWGILNLTSLLLTNRGTAHKVGLARYSTPDAVSGSGAAEVEELMAAECRRCVVELGFDSVLITRLGYGVHVLVPWSLHGCAGFWLLMVFVGSHFLLASLLLKFRCSIVIAAVWLTINLSGFATGYVALLVRRGVVVACFCPHWVEVTRCMLVVAWRRQLAVLYVILRSHCLSRFLN